MQRIKLSAIDIMRKLDKMSSLHWEISNWVHDRVTDKGLKKEISVIKKMIGDKPITESEIIKKARKKGICKKKAEDALYLLGMNVEIFRPRRDKYMRIEE